METVLLGYCGLFCGACPLNLGFKTDENGNRCQGCRSAVPAGHCLTCAIKACAIEKGFASCDECDLLPECDKMQGFMADSEWPYHRGVLHNFDAIRASGVGQWIADQQVRWSCVHCASAHSWWDETCPNCGESVRSFRVDLM